MVRRTGLFCTTYDEIRCVCNWRNSGTPCSPCLLKLCVVYYSIRELPCASRVIMINTSYSTVFTHALPVFIFSRQRPIKKYIKVRHLPNFREFLRKLKSTTNLRNPSDSRLPLPIQTQRLRLTHNGFCRTTEYGPLKMFSGAPGAIVPQASLYCCHVSRQIARDYRVP